VGRSGAGRSGAGRSDAGRGGPPTAWKIKPQSSAASPGRRGISARPRLLLNAHRGSTQTCSNCFAAAGPAQPQASRAPGFGFFPAGRGVHAAKHAPFGVSGASAAARTPAEAVEGRGLLEALAAPPQLRDQRGLLMVALPPTPRGSVRPVANPRPGRAIRQKWWARRC
jgi:hypothetical protein